MRFLLIFSWGGWEDSDEDGDKEVPQSEGSEVMKVEVMILTLPLQGRQ